MSTRSMLEINHDRAPLTPYEKRLWADRMVLFMKSGDRTILPDGVTFFNERHHSDDCPLGEPPYGWDNKS